MKYFKANKNLIPTLFLAILMIIAFYDHLRGNNVLGIKHLLAFGMVVIDLAVYFVFRKFYKFALILTIILGLFNFLVFTSATWTYCFSINGFKICLQPQSFIAALITYFLNFKTINNFIKLGLKKEQTEGERKENEMKLFNESVQEFKVRFKDYGRDKLNQIVLEGKHLPEAAEAAKQLLKEAD